MIDSWIASPLRKTPLPTAELVGDFLISDRAIQDLFNALRQQSREGRDSDGNEGLAFLAGSRGDVQTFYSTVIIPQVRNTFGSVFVDPGEFGRCAKRARAVGLQILGQVHSHPGTCCHHSDGDDKLIIMPFDGMLSIVVPDYASRDVPLSLCGVHQYQRGAWRLCTDSSVRAHFVTAPSVIRTT